ncbi:MAG: hypothetical protein L0Z51_09840 [Candidatus Latescibacteria bacterium]|nr:hypothetical protein [Candidatus Latescibacterota bacterium]
MRVVFRILAVIVAAAALHALPAHAEQPARSGFSAGFGLGGASVSWTWPDDERRREESGAGNARFAWALDQDLLVGLELWGWTKDYEIGSVPEDVPAQTSVWAATVAATYFPGNTGFFMRGGIGVGGGRAEVTPPPSVDFPVSGSKSDTGLSLLGAMGYEAGVSTHLSLGGAAHVVYVGIDAAPFDDVFGYGLTVVFNWYW